MMYGDWIGRWGRAYPEKEALVDAIHNQRYTYVQLADDIHCLAHFLNDRLNIRRGDRVACLALNRAEIIKLFFALSRLGAILVPLNFRLASAEFTYYLEDAAPKAIFFDNFLMNQDAIPIFNEIGKGLANINTAGVLPFMNFAVGIKVIAGLFAIVLVMAYGTRLKGGKSE